MTDSTEELALRGTLQKTGTSFPPSL